MGYFTLEQNMRIWQDEINNEIKKYETKAKEAEAREKIWRSLFEKVSLASAEFAMKVRKNATPGKEDDALKETIRFYNTMDDIAKIKVLEGVKCCLKDSGDCGNCPYEQIGMKCGQALASDIKELLTGEDYE